MAGETLLTSGIDVGTRAIKTAIVSHQGARSTVLAKILVPIQGRRDDHDTRVAIRESWRRALAEASLSAGEIDHVASTGTRDRQILRVGQLYGPSSHGVGARLLFPDATVTLDVGVSQIRSTLLSERRSDLRYATTRRETGGGSAMLEALTSRTAVTLDQAAPLTAATPLREELALRAVRLLGSVAEDGKAVLTGGMVLDPGFVRSLWGGLLESRSKVSLLISREAIFAGAYGAAILAARRFLRISRIAGPAATDLLAQNVLQVDRSSLN